MTVYYLNPRQMALVSVAVIKGLINRFISSTKYSLIGERIMRSFEISYVTLSPK